MNDIQNYLNDLLTIDCEVQKNLQHLLLVASGDALEAKSNEIKRGIREFKEKLNEMKDFTESFNINESGSFLSKFTRSSPQSDSDSSSSKEVFINQLQIEKEHLSNIENRFRNAYLSAKIKIEQSERESLFGGNVSQEQIEVKKRNLTSQMLVKKNNDLTSKFNEVNRQLKWTQNQTSDILPVLKESSNSIKNVQQDFGLMKSSISEGRRLLVRLGRREFTDKTITILYCEN
ncbi:vesicle transport SEC20 [Brachionus plicatilis]|uniref:Vesicle transport SEC20 n=1 Tax=Brachionus plicatilis TaxID=10195 RepID=A0A3M7TAF0_BRAPC|nr:vesicle transport SEC20 [Brachionus plicatilis]